MVKKNFWKNFGKIGGGFIFITMNKRALFKMMEYYLLDEFVKKRTSVKNNTYFFIEDKGLDPDLLDDDKPVYVSYAYYSKNDKTLYLYSNFFTENSKIKSIPTYDNFDETISDIKVLDLVGEWFKLRFPELDIKHIKKMSNYMFENEIPDRFEEDMVDIGPSNVTQSMSSSLELPKGDTSNLDNTIDKKELLNIMEIYILKDLVKKRTNVDNDVYFYIKNPNWSEEEVERTKNFVVEKQFKYNARAYYSNDSKTLYLYPSFFTNNPKIKTIPTYNGKNKTINGIKIFNLVVEWFKEKFPELDIENVEPFWNINFLQNVDNLDYRFEEDHVDIGQSNISEDIRRIKELLK